MFDSYSRYYDLLYRDKDYASEATYIKRLLAQHAITEGSLLEFGSGTGKHASALSSFGFTVHGIERSASMVAQASLVNGFTCQQGDIGLVKIDKTFDAIISLFHVISYQVSNHQLQLVFDNASKHLLPGGLFIFDFWYTPAVYSQKPSIRVKRMADENFEITRIAEPMVYPDQNRVDVNFTVFVRDLSTNEIQSFTESHPMRHFSLPEIDIFASIHGFQRVLAQEFLTGQAPSENTWGVSVVLRRV